MVFLISLSLNNYQRQMKIAEEEAENANKVHITIPSHQEEGPKEIKIPSAKWGNASSLGSHVENNVDRTHTIRVLTDVSNTPPRVPSPKAQNQKPHPFNEDEENNFDESSELIEKSTRSPIGRINRTTYSGSAVGQMVGDGDSSNEKQF